MEFLCLDFRPLITSNRQTTTQSILVYMKHIYTQSSAANTLQSATSALGTALSGKIFTLLLLSFFLLLSGKSMGQDVMTPYNNDFTSNSGITIPTPTRGSIAIQEGQLRGLTINGNTPGYSGYIIINRQFNLRPGYTYTAIFTARANNQQNNSDEGNIELFRGTSSTIPGTNSLGSVLIAKSAEFRSYAITFMVPSSYNQQYISIKLSNFDLQNSQNAHLYIEDLSITESCAPAAPQGISNSTCDTENVKLRLSATGATAGETYRWYSQATGGTAFTVGVSGNQGEFFDTPILTQTETIYYVARANTVGGSNCESVRVPVKAIRGSGLAPEVSSSVNCPQSAFTLTATGATGTESYRWYTQATEGTLFSSNPSINVSMTNEEQRFYVAILKEGGCESQRKTVYVMKKNQSPALPTVPNVSRCGSGPVSITASGAVDGEDYVWYTNQQGGTAIFRGTTYNTHSLPIGTTKFYVSKINNALGCESSRVLVNATAIAFKDSPQSPATGTIVLPSNPTVGQTARFSYTTSSTLDKADVISHSWYMHYSDGSVSPAIPSQTLDYVELAMPNNLTGVEVHLTINPSVCYTTSQGGVIVINNLSITPLPVELLFFNAKRDTKGVMLTWATASELDNKGFEVQVSTNARNFTAIGFVESKVGTTLSKQNYSFLDTKAVSGTRYYRLKQIDFDGTTAFSPVKAVVLNDGNNKVSAYPNPFDDVVVVTLNGVEARNVQVILMDAMGKVIQQRTEETSGNSITVDMRSITAKGIYVLHVYDNDTRHTFKLMKR